MKRYNALIVDDEESILMLIKAKLNSEGYEVDIAYNGIEATDRIADRLYDFVITDIHIPGKIHGFDVLKAAKERSNRTDVIMMTAFGTVENAVKAVKRGATDFVQKPLNFDELMVRLDKINKARELNEYSEDLRESMDVSEKGSAETIRDLEIMIYELQTKSSEIKHVLSDESVDAQTRIQKAINML